MTTLADRVAEMAQQLRNAADEDAHALELAVEAAALVAAADAARARPAALHEVFRSHPPEEAAAARARAVRDLVTARAELVAESLSTAEVAARLGLSPAAVTKRRVAGRLVAFRARGDWRYPDWQLDLPGVERVWQALPRTDRDAFGLVRWFGLPSRHLGTTPLEALRAGEVDRVVDAASYVGGW